LNHVQIIFQFLTITDQHFDLSQVAESATLAASCMYFSACIASSQVRILMYIVG
jgi:hypothetical protein